MLVPATVYTYVVVRTYPMPGIAGGRPGAPNRLQVRVGGGEAHEVGDTAGYIEHAAGECYEYHYGGGGGWGDPLARPPVQVLDDVLDEYVSIEAAEREYGVVLTGSLENLTLTIDGPATTRRRAEMRARTY
jgi:N-methylhydantoinase B